MEDIDLCRICGKPIKIDEGRIMESGGLSQAHPICYWHERTRLEEATRTQEDEESN